VASCRSSPPKRFYVLEAVPPQPQQRSTTDATSGVQVAAVNIPASLDRQEMVRESAAESLEVSDVNRWGAPLADMAQNVLTRDLMQRLPAEKVIPPRLAAPAATYEITADLLQFGRDATGKVNLAGAWSLYRLGSDAPLLTRNIELSEPTREADYSAQARAMSRLLGRLADDIAAELPAR
jgi:uncharacterized protein